MKYKRFEELPVWQTAGRMAAQMFRFCSQSNFRGKGDLGSQLQRATLSISNNIAEGFERGTTNELIHFLYIARGSAGEVRSMLSVMIQMPEFDQLKPQIEAFREQSISVSRQLAGWASSLQNSDIKGQRHLNDRSRAQYDRRKKRDKREAELQTWRKDMEVKLNARADENRTKKSK